MPGGGDAVNQVMALGGLVQELGSTIGAHAGVVGGYDRPAAIDEPHHLVAVVQVAHQRGCAVAGDSAGAVRVDHDWPTRCGRRSRGHQHDTGGGDAPTVGGAGVVQDPCRVRRLTVDPVFLGGLLTDQRAARCGGQRARGLVERRAFERVLLLLVPQPLADSVTLDPRVGLRALRDHHRAQQHDGHHDQSTSHPFIPHDLVGSLPAPDDKPSPGVTGRLTCSCARQSVRWP